MHSFSTKSFSILKAAGWKEGRKVEVASYIQRLEQEGCTVFPVVRTFLEEFSGLILRRPNPVEPRIISSLDLRLEQTLLNVSRGRVEAFSEDLEVALCPIGEDNNAIEYVMDREGKVYGLYYPIVLFIGESGEQAVENYCHWSPSNPFPIILDLSDES